MVRVLVGTLADMIDKLVDLPLHCDPGSEWNYGISTDIVGYLCEVISGQPFDEYLRERIFTPLGMADTGFVVPPEKVERFAACYSYDAAAAKGASSYTLQDSPGESLYLGPRTYFSGAGGLVSTAADYLRFCKMLTGRGTSGTASILGSRDACLHGEQSSAGRC